MLRQQPLLLVAFLSLWLQSLNAQDFSISKDSVTKILDMLFNKANNKKYEEALKLQNFSLEWGKKSTNNYASILFNIYMSKMNGYTTT